MHLSNKENILLVICHTITAANGSIALWYFVKRAKQCLGEFSRITVQRASKRYKSRSGIHQSGAIGATGDLKSLETRGNLFQKKDEYLWFLHFRFHVFDAFIPFDWLHVLQIISLYCQLVVNSNRLHYPDGCFG